MTPILENSFLSTPLDCNGFDLLDVGMLDPVPPPMISVDDPALSDQRAPVDGSVTDYHVAMVAEITQDKLLLNGNIPSGWVGIDGAAQGNLVERIARKGQVNGYASLDSTGHIPSAQVPHTAATGTVTSVGLHMPTRTFNVTGSPVTTNGTLEVFWDSAPNNSWLANAPIPGGDLRPQFITSPPSLSFIPSLDAGLFTSGTFHISHLKLAKWAASGTDHYRGVAPDPGQFTNKNDYLARNIHYLPFPVPQSYQVDMPAPKISVIFEEGKNGFTVVIRSAVKDSVLFYRLGTDDDFVEAIQSADDNNSDVFGFSSKTLTLQYGDYVEAYAAKQGYNDSPFASYEVTPPPP